MEIWDSYDRNFQKIEGLKLVRGEAVPDGVFHLVCEIIVRHVDGTYLLTQRDARKHYGGMWEATSGGAAICGETPLECVVRELREETGIEANNPTELGRVLSEDSHCIYVEFLCITDCVKDSIVLQEGETSAYKWVTKDELVNMKKSELVTKRMQRFLDELQS